MTNDETDSTTAPTDELIDRREYMKAAGATAVTGLGIGAMATSAAAQETLTENQQTSYDGSFVSFWTDTDDTVSMTLEDGGSYSVDWQNTGNFVVGMGWDPGASRTIEYDATHNPSENSYLCIYGWTTDPLVEYYIIENYGTYRPGDEEHGTHQSDGGTYDIATSERIEEPSIEGTATFTQYWSIRQNSRTSGTVNIGNHFDAWESHGLELGNHDYQIMAVEAWDYQGPTVPLFRSAKPAAAVAVVAVVAAMMADQAAMTVAPAVPLETSPMAPTASRTQTAARASTSPDSPPTTARTSSSMSTGAATISSGTSRTPAAVRIASRTSTAATSSMLAASQTAQTSSSTQTTVATTSAST